MHQWLRLAQSPVSHREKWIATLGAFVAIALVWEISLIYISDALHLMMVASMGASAVLLFAVPHGPLSQPWAVLGGHVISALIGVTCALWIPHPLFAAALAVAFSIFAMAAFRCIHPPGGATALTAVIGGEAVHQLGYQFVITPVLIDSLIMVAVAILFNNLFASRHYPVTLSASPSSEKETFSHQEFLNAFKEIDSFVDVHETELNRILNFMIDHHQAGALAPEQIHLGQYYSNGKLGADWSIRQIIDEDRDDRPEKDYVIFRQKAGKEPKTSDCITRSEFARWAKYPVRLDQGQWHRISPDQLTSEQKERLPSH